MGYGVSTLDEMLDLRIGIGLHEIKPLFNTGFNAVYLDTTVLLRVTDNLHFGAGIRYDIVSTLDPYDGSNSHNIGNELGTIYVMEYAFEDDWFNFRGSKMGRPYFAVRYSKINYISPVTSAIEKGNSLGFHFGFYGEG